MKTLIDGDAEQGIVIRPRGLHAEALGTVTQSTSHQEFAEMVVPRRHVQVAQQQNRQRGLDVVRELIKLFNMARTRGMASAGTGGFPK
ncbi:MAG: hypothetical protein ACI9QL_004095 [Candidatus Omnitrophota bacterium]|jgi:hypothetical protein